MRKRGVLFESVNKGYVSLVYFYSLAIAQVLSSEKSMIVFSGFLLFG